MNNFYNADLNYTTLKNAQMKAINPDSVEVHNLRQSFKELTGKALRAFFVKNNIHGIGSSENITCWCTIARNSDVFKESVSMLECMMAELLPNDEQCIDLGLRRSAAKSKSELNEIFALARKEAKIIKLLYDRVSKYNPNYDGNLEYRKIRKALIFMRRALLSCLYSKLPTTLFAQEYNELQKTSSKPGIVSLRYRFDDSLKEYTRIGGLPRKPAYRLFGVRGCSVLVKKSIYRYEVMLGSVHQ